MDERAWLAEQVAWGADEALDVAPRDRLGGGVVDRVALPAVVAAAAAAAVSPAVGSGVGGAVAEAEALAAGCASVAGLLEALAGFEACALAATAISLVFVAGDAASGLMVIGDAPGEEEDRSGVGFSGPGGRLLDRMLGSIGLDRGAVALVHAVPWRPPGNRQPTEHERALCLPFVRRLLVLARPARLLLLGGQPAASLLGVSPGAVRRLRGQWQSVVVGDGGVGIAALPTFSPEHLLANPAAKREAWGDLLTLRVALDGGGA